MAAETTSAPVPQTTRPPRPRRTAIPPFYKALIWTSFLINAALVIILAVLAGTVIQQQRQLAALLTATQSFAAQNISELETAVGELQSAVISRTIQLDTSLPVELNVPINRGTILTPRNVVTLVEPVPIQAPAAITFPGGGGNLNATVNIVLPQGLELPVDLNMDVRLTTAIPVKLDVPVEIPLRETDLGVPFDRLGAVVRRLVDPVRPYLPTPTPQEGRPEARLPREEPLPEPGE